VFAAANGHLGRSQARRLSTNLFPAAALGKDDGGHEEDAAKAKPALPNLYLDMRTIYATLPAGSNVRTPLYAIKN